MLAPVSRPTVTLTRADGSPLRVLVVDDEANIAELVSMALRYEGWETSVAHTGRSAVSTAKDVRPTRSCSTSCCPTSTAWR